MAVFVRPGLAQPAALQAGPGRERAVGFVFLRWELRRGIEGGEAGDERSWPRAIWRLLHISQRLCFSFLEPPASLPLPQTIFFFSICK